jgi:hypothetical protein
METKIVIRKGSTVPGSGLLVTGELAWDDAGKSLYAGQDGAAAIKVGPGTGGSPAPTTFTYLTVLGTATPIPSSYDVVWIKAHTLSVTMQTLPEVAAGSADGQRLLLMGLHNGSDQYFLILDDQGSVPGSGLKLHATQRSIHHRESLELVWDASTSSWIEIDYASNAVAQPLPAP